MPSSTSSNGSASTHGSYGSTWFPTVGFIWQNGNRSSKISVLRTAERNSTLMRAIAKAARHGRTTRQSDAEQLLVETFECVARMRRGSLAREHILDFLSGVREGCILGRELPENMWIELMYQVVWARDEYLRKTSKARQDAERSQVPELARAADNLLKACNENGNAWEWASLEMMAYPNELLGELSD
ncbi:hypothetical protein QBC40DRAFT_251436 [Triangularia verruculosa]|uniref:Uncharacterized protein n=1 Tax=Triangularia verruculosa TaxID=2587418 RepID=A0AAN6XPV9_9PEZI|nr:hypothetical protein QBC40DRAFT_251436 [Triangularia verruculosa]